MGHPGGPREKRGVLVFQLLWCCLKKFLCMSWQVQLNTSNLARIDWGDGGRILSQYMQLICNNFQLPVCIYIYKLVGKRLETWIKMAREPFVVNIGSITNQTARFSPLHHGRKGDGARSRLTLPGLSSAGAQWPLSCYIWLGRKTDFSTNRITGVTTLVNVVSPVN